MAEPNNLGDLIDRTRDQGRLALIDLRIPDAPREYSFGDIDRLCGGVARFLTARGLPRGSRIGIASLNRVEYVAAYLGAMRAGYVAVPINIKLAPDIIAFILDDADVALTFADAASRGRLPANAPVIGFDDDGPGGFAAQITPAEFQAVTPAPDEIAQILYTSGSTGRPKGVPLSHAGQLWVLEVKRESLPPGDDERQIVAQPLFHMNGLIVIKLALLRGATMVMMPSFDAAAYTEALHRYRITSVFAIPTMFARVEKELISRPELDLSHLKTIVLASAPVTIAMMERIKRAIPSASVANSYGTTEAGAAVFGPHPDGLPTPMLSIGYPLQEGEVRLVDGPSADQGTLVMRNPAVMAGYHKLPEKSAEVLHDGWYYSGDVMRRDENGFYFFVGRADDMFVSSGENIYPAEVEKMLEGHPDIQQAAVVPLPDEERSHIPVAFIVPRSGADLTYGEVKSYALANAPAYQHPRRVTFVAELPWAGTNKIDRRALLERARVLEADGGWSG